jgi:tRNA synthetases class I (W and Y)
MASSSGAEALASQLSSQAKFDLLTRDLAEVLGGDKVKEILDKGERPVRAYWGTAPTGRPHIGYFVPFTKLADFLTAGTEVKVLLAGKLGRPIDLPQNSWLTLQFSSRHSRIS